MIWTDSVAAVTVWDGIRSDGLLLRLRIRVTLTRVQSLSLEVAMLLLPTFCPDCNEPTMEVVEHRPNDSYEARCTACGCHTFGKISPELLIVKAAVDSTR
jgi:hypothetical protein